MLQHILSSDYSLALSPGFFRFYAHIGVLAALHEKGCLRPNAVSGSSAGALVGCFLSAGMSPAEMIESVLKIKRSNMWDMGGVGGLLKGMLFQQLVRDNLPVKTFEECKIPLGVTAYDLLRFKTRSITSGDIAVAVVASCTFPGLFQPVMIDSSPHIDGGVWDDSGLMALPHAIAQGDAKNIDNKDRLVVNITFEGGPVKISKLPVELAGSRVLTIMMENIPMVHPFSMDTMGEVAYNTAKAATLRALEGGSHIQEVEPNHWVCFIDGNLPKTNKKRTFDSNSGSSSSSRAPEPPKKLVRIPSLSFVSGSLPVVFEDHTVHCTEEHVRATSLQNRSIVSSGSLDRLVLTDFSPAAATTTAIGAKEGSSEGAKASIAVPAAPVRVVSASSTGTSCSGSSSATATPTSASARKRSGSSSSASADSVASKEKKAGLARRGSVKRFTRGSTTKK